MTYTSPSLQIYRAVNNDQPSEFVIWVPGGPLLAGPSVDSPWWNFFRWPNPTYVLSDGSHAQVQMQGKWRYGLVVEGETRLVLCVTSIWNAVTAFWKDQRIGLFPAMFSEFDLDVSGLPQLEFELLLIAVGSGLPRRTRRGSAWRVPRASNYVSLGGTGAGC